MFSWWSSSRRDTSVWSCRNISREFHANSLLQLSLSLNSLRNAQGRRHKNRPKYVELTFSIYYNLHRERERGASWREEGGHPSNAAISSRVPTFPRRCSERTKHVWIAYCNCNWKCSTHQKYVSVSWKKIMTRRRWREARFISADGVVVYENVARVSTKRMRPCSSGRVDDVLSRLGCALHLLRCLFIIISRRAAARESEGSQKCSLRSKKMRHAKCCVKYTHTSRESYEEGSDSLVSRRTRVGKRKPRAMCDTLLWQPYKFPSVY